MQYAFILGRVYTLSLAELFLVLAKLEKEFLKNEVSENIGEEISGQGNKADNRLKILAVSLEVIVIESPRLLDVENLQRRLGGSIKILKIIDIVKKRENDSVNFALQHYFKPSKLKKDFLKDYKGKIQFGVSVYLLDMQIRAFGEPKRLGMFIKRSMQDAGSSIRLVLPEFNSLALASVVVTKNLLLQKGAEISALADKDRVYVAKTLTVQDFEDYGRRDYQRPVRNELQGMIPPKVAQIMLNLANANTNNTLLDPFCGIGTLIQEGILMNYKMLGTDINKEAIDGSEKNLEWFRNRYKISKARYHLDLSDAMHVSKLIERLKDLKAISKIDSIVTEGYLGPLYSKFPKISEIEANFSDLKALYQACFMDFYKFLPMAGRVVICFPAYKKGLTEYEKLGNLDFITSLGYNLVELIPQTLVKKLKFLRITERDTVIYDRKDQIVAREIVIFEKIKR